MSPKRLCISCLCRRARHCRAAFRFARSCGRGHQGRRSHAEPSAAELFDGQIIRLAEKSLEYRHYLDFVVGHPDSLMLVEFSGETDEEVRRGAADLRDRCAGCPACSIRSKRSSRSDAITFGPAARRRCRCSTVCRECASRSRLSKTRPSIPVGWSEFVARFREIIARAGTVGAFYGHASVGCLHIRPMLDAADRGDRRADREDFGRSLRPGDRISRRDERRAWRRTGAQLFERTNVRPADLRGIQAD